MGSDAHVYVFDHARFMSEIVPIVHTALATGALAPEAEEVWGRIADEPWPRLGGCDLVRDCTYLRPGDLAFEGAIDHPGPWYDHWEARACDSLDCPSRTQCPFHLSRRDATEDVIGLIEALVVDRCLGESQFLGRSVNVAFYRDLLHPTIFDQRHPLTPLLEALGRRGRVIGYLFSNSDGIHGWLDPAETGELAKRLSRLHLPQYDATFDAMKTFRHRLEGPYGGTSYEPPPTFSFEQLSLSYVRTVATIAAQRQRGILWGNDLRSSLDRY